MMTSMRKRGATARTAPPTRSRGRRATVVKCLCLGCLILAGGSAQAQEGIGVGMGMDVEYITPQRFRDRTPTRVAVIYSSLHKQVHNLPDLIPRETQPNYCERDAEGRLIVTIRNQGEADAPASTTRIVFGSGETADRSTPPLAIGAEASLGPIPVPRSGEGLLPFTITADVEGTVAEMNEPNNIAFGGCLIIN